MYDWRKPKPRLKPWSQCQEPNLHYGEDWTHWLEDSPQKKLWTQDPQTLTVEWLLSHEELSATESQFHQKATEPEV